VEEDIFVFKTYYATRGVVNVYSAGVVNVYSAGVVNIYSAGVVNVYSAGVVSNYRRNGSWGRFFVHFFRGKICRKFRGKILPQKMLGKIGIFRGKKCTKNWPLVFNSPDIITATIALNRFLTG
jgi:hypothetical protein